MTISLPVKQMSLTQITQSHLCSGCGVCSYLESDAIEMVDTQSQGRRPRLKYGYSDSDVMPETIACCPGIHEGTPEAFDDEKHIESLYDDWGPVMAVYEGHAADQEICYRGSSGGAITAIALYAMEKKAYAGTLHVKAREDQPVLNEARLSEFRHELMEGCGSRYAPASPAESLEKIENADAPCVMIGKPCDINAASKAARLKPELKKNLGLTIGLFCAGTPALSGTLSLLKALKIKKDIEQLKRLNYRGEGWPGDMQACYEDGARSKPISYSKGWGEILQQHRQWRCHLCSDHSGEHADIAIGDPWYKKQGGTVKDRHEGRGRSLIVARTARGKAMIEAAINDGYLVAEAISPHLVNKAQPHLLKTRGAVWGRTLAMKLMGLKTPDHAGRPLFKAWKRLGMRDKVRSLLGTAKRIYKKKIHLPESQTVFNPESLEALKH